MGELIKKITLPIEKLLFFSSRRLISSNWSAKSRLFDIKRKHSFSFSDSMDGKMIFGLSVDHFQVKLFSASMVDSEGNMNFGVGESSKVASFRI